MNRNDSIVDGLLGDIYDRVNTTRHSGGGATSALKDDSEVFQSEFSISSWRMSGSGSSDLESEKRAKHSMEALSKSELNDLANQLNAKISQMSAKLIRQLKQRDKLKSKLNKNCDLLTAFLQARSLKRSK